MIEADIARILIHRDAIRARIHALGLEIAATYEAEEDDAGLTLLPILSGSIIFLADLIRELPLKMKLALVQISTYPGTSTTPGTPRTVLDLIGDVQDRHVLLVDDILDSGRTLRRVQSLVAERHPRSLRSAVLLRKPARAPADVFVDFVGFDIDDAFVVGYGLDFNDLYRNYPHVAVLRPELLP
ncbi:MAG: hypoxanthine phosphoribosyltransferase [Phycisphaerales bacterium]|nr:hypoxanthine phosphoribosyltransferase [Phycisphaerales bacterium]